MTQQIFPEPSLLQHTRHTELYRAGKTLKSHTLGETDPQSGPEVEKMYSWSPKRLINRAEARQTP